MPVIQISTKSNPFATIKSGWRQIGEKRIYFRSAWEAKYAYFLEWQKTEGLIADWDYEPETFWFEGIKRGCVSYKPDFRVLTGHGETIWIEVKGYMDSKSKTKIARFKAFYPHLKLLVVDKSWFDRHGGMTSQKAALSVMGAQEFMKHIFYKRIEEQMDKKIEKAKKSNDKKMDALIKEDKKRDKKIDMCDKEMKKKKK